MLKFLFLAAIITGFLLKGFSQSVQKHYPSYSFTIESDLGSAADAFRIDSTLLLLKGMVMSAETDAATKKCKVRVVSSHTPYESIKFFLGQHGYISSVQYVMKAED